MVKMGKTESLLRGHVCSVFEHSSETCKDGLIRGPDLCVEGGIALGYRASDVQ
jgi:hypothetical protein